MSPLIPVVRRAELSPELLPDPAPYELRYLVNGEIRRAEGPGLEVRSPILVEGAAGPERALLGFVPALDSTEAMRALEAARAAWDGGRGEWPTARVAKRVSALERFAEVMGRVRAEVVRLLMWEIGKTVKDAESEFDRTVTYVKDTVEALKELDRQSSRFQTEEGFIGQIRRAPLGVVLCMGPFNYPLNETYTTLIPALVMGNVVVSKLPKYGSLLHLPLLQAMQQCFPPGVVNVVQGDGPTVVGPMMESGLVDVLAFIGTARVANILKKQHPRPNRLRCITGLEAKNPAVILPCADVALAARECAQGALGFNGQRCTAVKLVLVHRSLERPFLEALVREVSGLQPGLPWGPGVKLTPLPEHGKPALLAGLVQDAVAQGAGVLNARGGEVEPTYFHPAVVHPVTPAMKLYTVEQFGPVVPVATYDDDREIEAFMRHSDYGQQIALFGTDPARLASLIDQLTNQVCRINLNTQCRRGPDTFPFTGRKDSAEGTLSVSDALRAFSIRTMVAIGSNARDKGILSEIVAGRRSRFLSTDYLL